jgi:hypothetical protein
MIQAASFTLPLCSDTLPYGPLHPSRSDTLLSRPALPPIPSGTPPFPVWQPPKPICRPPPLSGPSRRPCLALPSPSLLATTSLPTSPSAPHPVSPHVWPPPDCQAHLFPHKVNGWLNIYGLYLFSYVHTCRKSSLQFDNIC